MIEYNDKEFRRTSHFIQEALNNGEDYEFIISKLGETGITRHRALVMINYTKEGMNNT